MRWSSLLASTCAILAIGAQAIDVKDIKVLLTTATGGSDKTYKLQPNQKLDTPVDLEVDGILRLTFTAQPTPKYAHVEFTDAETDSSWTYEVPVKSDGKARFELKASALPAPLRRSSGTLTLSLALSSPQTKSPAYTSPVMALRLPGKRLLPALPHRHSLDHKEERDPAFKTQKEIEWTFGTGEKPVNVVVSLIGTLIVLGQVGWLAVMVSSLLSGRRMPSPTNNGYLFLGTLAGIEALIVKYWINGRIYTFLPPFLALSLVSAYIGKNALRDVQIDRLASKLRAA